MEENNSELWTEKYRPKTLDAIHGSPTNVSNLVEWGNSFRDGSKPSFPGLLMSGPAGIGKTSAAISLGNDYGWETVEFNASDVRTHDMILHEIMPIALTQNFKSANSRILIILDEVDSLHTSGDKNANKAILQLLTKTKHPIVLTCNDPYPIPTTIQDKCVLTKWQRMREGTIRKTLLKILTTEKIKVPIETVNTCITPGDLRSSITNLQACVLSDSKITFKQTASISNFEMVSSIFRCENPSYINNILLEANIKPDDAILWISENVPLFYKGIELVNAYDQLSLADTYLAKARQTQNYAYWSLAIRHMTTGVANCRIRPISSYYVKTDFPSVLRKLKASKEHRRVVWSKEGLGSKLGKAFHCSKYVAMNSMFPIVQKTCIDNLSYLLQLKILLNLNEKEVAKIIDTIETDPRVKRIMNPEFVISDEAEAIIERQENKQKSVLDYFR